MGETILEKEFEIEGGLSMQQDTSRYDKDKNTITLGRIHADMLECYEDTINIMYEDNGQVIPKALQWD